MHSIQAGPYNTTHNFLSDNILFSERYRGNQKQYPYCFSMVYLQTGAVGDIGDTIAGLLEA